MPGFTDNAVVSDEVSFAMNGEPLDVTIMPNAQTASRGAAEVYYQIYPVEDGWEYRVVTRSSELVDTSETFNDEGAAFIAAHIANSTSDRPGSVELLATTTGPRLEGDDHADH